MLLCCCVLTHVECDDVLEAEAALVIELNQIPVSTQWTTTSRLTHINAQERRRGQEGGVRCGGGGGGGD
jgi:hypothetical protein